MDWKRFGRSALCLLVVLALLLNICAVEARATGLEAVASFLGLPTPALPVIGAVLAGIGVLYVAGSTDWDKVVRDCAAYLTDAGFIDDDGNIRVFQKVADAGETAVEWFVSCDLVEAIRAWLFASETLTVGQENIYGEVGFLIDDKYNSLSRQFWRTVDIYSLLNSSTEGFLLTSYYTKYCGLSLEYVDSYGTIMVISRSLSSLAPYTSSDFPLGSVVSGFDYCEEDRSNFVFRNYEECLAYWQIHSGDYFFLIPSSYIDFNTTSGGHYYSCFLCNVGYLQSDGTVDYGRSVRMYWSPHDYVQVTYGLYPATTSIEREITTGFDFGIGFAEVPEKTIDVAYPTWYGNSITITDTDTGEQTVVLPIVNTGTYEDTKELTQEQVWAGTLSDAIVDAQTGTVAGTPIADFWAGLTDVIVTPIVDALSFVFVPSETFVAEKVSNLRLKFRFADSILGTFERFGRMFDNLNSSPPVIYVDLGATTGDYDFGGEVVFIDFSWYAPYKPIVDALLSAFMWLVFLWRVGVHLPNLIMGEAAFAPVYTAGSVSGSAAAHGGSGAANSGGGATK